MSWLLPQLPPNFRAALRDVHAVKAESRMAAAERLGRAEGDEREEAIAGLEQLAADVHPGVRATALAALGLVGSEEDLGVVIAAFEDDAAEVREFAALAAAQIGGDRALALLERALSSPAPEVRFQAVAGVAELAPEQAATLLAPLLSDADPEVRAQVVGALASIDEPHLVGHLAGMLDDDDARVRIEAALALASFGDPRAEPHLLEALHRRNRVAEAARALGKLDCKKAAEPIALLARGFRVPPHLRAELGAALVELGDPRGAGLLRKVLKGLRADARSYAVELAREVRARELVPELAALAQRPRGVDLLTLADTLNSFAAEAEPARLALEGLARRGDAVGEAARRALTDLQKVFQRAGQP